MQLAITEVFILTVALLDDNEIVLLLDSALIILLITYLKTQRSNHILGFLLLIVFHSDVYF